MILSTVPVSCVLQQLKVFYHKKFNKYRNRLTALKNILQIKGVYRWKLAKKLDLFS
jgi:hypothetical protein